MRCGSNLQVEDLQKAGLTEGHLAWQRERQGLQLIPGPCGLSPGDLSSFPDLPDPWGQAGIRLLIEQVGVGAI